jgi:hypothetical protein
MPIVPILHSQSALAAAGRNDCHLRGSSRADLVHRLRLPIRQRKQESAGAGRVSSFWDSRSRLPMRHKYLLKTITQRVQVWKPPDSVAARAGHGWEGHLFRDVQQSPVSCFALGLRGCSQGLGTCFLHRSGCRRHLFIDSLSGGLDRFHPRGTFRSRGTNDVAVSRKAAQRAISAQPLSTCYLRPPTRGGLILGYGGANAHQIHEGIRKLRICVQGQIA